MSIELVMPSNHLILCRPLLLLPSIFPSIRVFSTESDFCSVVSDSETPWTATRQVCSHLLIPLIQKDNKISLLSPSGTNDYDLDYKCNLVLHHILTVFHSGSFRMDLLDLLAVQGTLKSLLQHHSSKASILQRSALFMIQ